MTANTNTADCLQRCIAEIVQLCAAKAAATEIARKLQELRPLARAIYGRRGWTQMLSQIWPELSNPRERAAAILHRAQREEAKREQALLPKISQGDLALYERLIWISHQPSQEHSHLLGLESRNTGLSIRALRRKMHRALERGPDALPRRPRWDRGRTSLPEEVQQAFVQRRTDPAHRHETVQISIDAVRRQFPDLQIGDYPFRRLARSLPKAITMPEREWRSCFLPGGAWEVPHPNHTWAFDFTTADLFVWDGDPDERPYRPSLTAIVDECSQSCMYAIYSEAVPNQQIFQGVLLHAILPKANPLWIQHGLPQHLHADNGKVQDSRWLQEVCRTIGAELDLMGDLRHTQVRAPWQQGHVENFFGIVHQRFESQFAPAYCGRSPDHKPESHRNRGPHDWRQYPTLESLNAGLHAWISVEYHQRMRHHRLKMSRVQYWQLHAPGHIALPDRAEAYLHEKLMHKDRRQVRRGQIAINGYAYWAELLQGWEGCPLEVRWNPADLDRVLVIGTHGQRIWAERQRPGRVDHPADLAAHKQRQRAIKRERKVLREAAHMLPTASPENKQAFEQDLREEQARAPIPFPGGSRTIKPASPDDAANQPISIEEACREWGMNREEAERLAGPDGMISAGQLKLWLASFRSSSPAQEDEEPFEMYGLPI